MDLGRAVRGAYVGGRRAIQTRAYDTKREARARIDARKAKNKQARIEEIRGRSAEEQGIMFDDFKANNPDVGNVRGAKKRAEVMADANPMQGNLFGQFMNAVDGFQETVAINNAKRGLEGDLSRGATVAAITGGVTASGAALIDLMSFLTQGQQTENERDEVLPS